MNLSRSCHGYFLIAHVQCGRWSGRKWHVDTLDLLLIDYCMCISFAISSGFISILLIWSLMQSNVGVLTFLKTFLFIFLGLILYNSLYLDISFLNHSLVYLVVIFLAWMFVVLANFAISFIHTFFY